LHTLEKTPQPLSTTNVMTGVGNHMADYSLHQMLIALIGKLAISAEPSAASLMSSPASAPEAASAPTDPTTPVFEPYSTVSTPRRKWKHCPDLVPYVQEATLRNPLSDLALRDAIYKKTGYAPSLPAIRKHIRSLAQEGKIDVYTYDRDGNLFPFPDKRTTHKPYVVWKGQTNDVSQPIEHLPEPPEAAPVSGGGGPITEETLDALALPTSSAAILDTAPNPVPDEAAHEVPLAPEDLARWMRQYGIKKFVIQMEC